MVMPPPLLALAIGLLQLKLSQNQGGFEAGKQFGLGLKALSHGWQAPNPHGAKDAAVSKSRKLLTH